MERRNLVITAYGNGAPLIQDEWLKDHEIRNFDICVFFFAEHIEHPEYFKHVDFFYHKKGFKYHFIHELLTQDHPEFLEKYDHFYFLDDDVSISTHQINKLFNLSKAFECWIAQASLSADSYISWPILQHNKYCFARYVGQIEVMAPVFSRDALRICLPTFILNKTTWGVDSVWPKLLGYPKNKFVVFDEVQMTHTRPVGGGALYVNSENSDPKQDWERITKTYNAVRDNFIEYGRLQKVDDQYGLVQRQQIRLMNQLQKIRRKIKDTGIGWHLRNRLGIKQPA